MTGSDAGRVTSGPGFSDGAYAAFVSGFGELTGIHLGLYKEKQMRRRIGTLITRMELDGFPSLLALLRSDPEALRDFLGYITINVTEFFRTPDQWARFEEEALDPLARNATEKLKVWSAACSSGEEAYSLAMSLSERMDPSRFEVTATDLDERVLRLAEEGCWPQSALAAVPEERKERFFVREGGTMRVSDGLRANVAFRRLDLLNDPYPEDCDVIVCRNVLIYFTEEAKEMMWQKFRSALKPGGYLFTGNTEQMIRHRQYGFEKIENYLYRSCPQGERKHP